MAEFITRDIIEPFLHCKFKASLKLTGSAGTKPEYESLIVEIQERLSSTSYRDATQTSPPSEVLRDVNLSVSTLKRGASSVFNASIRHEETFLSIDALKRVPGSSKLGNYYYQPVLHYGGERITPPQRMVLANALSSIQGVESPWGFIVYGRRGTTRRLQLRPQSVQARRVMQDIKDIRAKTSTPQLIINNHCAICEFRQQCHAESVVKDDLSLLRAMSESEIKKQARKGVFTVTQLSYAFRVRKNNLPVNQKPRARQHAL